MRLASGSCRCYGHLLHLFFAHGRGFMQLGAFISGVFGTLGFSLSVLAGASADNTLEAVLLRAVACALVCYAVGYVVGLIAQQVALEHAGAISKAVAAEDEKAEQKRQEDLAAQAAAEAGAAATPPTQG
jgi:hypothetical protein